MRDGFRLFMKYPLPFSLMFVVFMAAAVIGSALPLLGGLVMLCAVPLLGLGFMVAAESALKGGPVHPGHFFSPLRTDARRRRALLGLCFGFGAATLGIFWLAHALDGGTFGQLQKLLAEEASREQIDALLADPRFGTGLLLRFGLTALLSIPFWHAPALVHWAGQGAAQALFSSSLSLWRARGAFAVYFLSWFGIVALFGLFSALAFGLLGVRQLAGLVALPAGLIFTTIFYVSLIFPFIDSFEGTGVTVSAP
jgi:hypothetical protein